MGISVNDLPRRSSSHHRTQKVFLLCNYILLGAASSCIFLTLSLRLIPSICGFLLILLHVFTIIGAVSGCATASSWTSRWYSAHMVATVLTAILQGSVSVLIITRTGDFLGEMKSYVREEDGSVILKLAGDGIGVGGVNTMSLRRSAKVQQDEDLKDWPWPFQV
ncbi:Transmembrane protein [Quillaja saponaria]|uniref:Transmembrane protein n=1 Tax=Quillaja saponaria TaxID=32244 RepID=A0AAD7Q2W9_QUISA|nr:Transmembrane protein [Quillaja saponaria]